MQEETTGQIMTQTSTNNQQFNHEWILALVFSFFFGCLGVHRFYVGKIGTGILMLITFGGFGIWSLIDLIIIATGNFKKKDGTLIPIKISV